jgi:hypothetical protein
VIFCSLEIVPQPGAVNMIMIEINIIDKQNLLYLMVFNYDFTFVITDFYG